MSPRMPSGTVAENSSVCRSAGMYSMIWPISTREAHVEHAVGLVQHQHAARASNLSVPAAQVVEHAARACPTIDLRARPDAFELAVHASRRRRSPRP